MTRHQILSEPQQLWENNMPTASTKVWSVLRGWHCPTRESAGSGETLPEQQALTITLAIAPASPSMSMPLHFSIWSAGNILWLQINFFFRNTLSKSGKRCFRLALDSNLLSDTPETAFFSPSVYSSPFLGSSKLILPPSLAQLHPLPQASGSPISKEPKRSAHHASKSPLFLASASLRPLWL